MRLLGQQRLLSQLFRTISFVLLVPFFCALMCVLFPR